MLVAQLDLTVLLSPLSASETYSHIYCCKLVAVVFGAVTEPNNSVSTRLGSFSANGVLLAGVAWVNQVNLNTRELGS